METDSIGRSKRPKRPKIKHKLSERLVMEDGSLEPIEEWIMRDSKKLVSEAPECVLQTVAIRDMKKEYAELGNELGREKRELLRVTAEVKREIKKFADEKRKKISEQKKKVREVQKLRTAKTREIKTEEAALNTMRNRYFTAVRNLVMQKMREICNIQHTWKDPKVKRDIQTAQIQPQKIANRRWRKQIEEELENE